MNLQSFSTDAQIAVVHVIAQLVSSRPFRKRISNTVVGELPREQARSLRLHLAGLHYKQIAIITDVTNDVALHRLSRAYHTIRMRGAH